MKIFRFDQDVGKKITHFNSDFVMSRIIRTEHEVQIGCMHLEANGIIGYHEASVSQLLLVVNGEGWVRGDGTGKVMVKAGDAVFWEKGEGHETSTADGLTAIVIESEQLRPTEFLISKE